MKRDITRALDYAFKKGFQIHPSVVDLLQEIEVGRLDLVVKDIIREKMVDRNYHISRADLVQYLGLDESADIEDYHNILFDCTSSITTPGGIEGYGELFRDRFEKGKRMILGRGISDKMQTITQLKNQLAAGEGKKSYVCGLVTAKQFEDTMSRLTVEDTTGQLEGVLSEDVADVIQKLFLDQFVAVEVEGGFRGAVFTDVLYPDIPVRKANRSESEVFAVFLSDLHVGSKYFLEEDFRVFLQWLSSSDPIARKVRFVLIAGDVVDGVGIFRDQDRELFQHTAYEQFQKVDELLAIIPEHIKIFVIPGNHDPGRRALPQPAIPRDVGASLWSRKNVFMLGNPSMVSLNGVSVMMFHGQSIDDIVKSTMGMDYSHPANVMKYMLKSRHLGSIYGNQTPIAPELKDLLVIDEVPDIFHAGHVHVMEVDSYKGTMVINSGTWQSQTPFQSSVGQIPTPGIVVLLNLKTFGVYIKKFSS